MAVLSYSFHISNEQNAVTNKGKLAQVSKHNTRGYSNGSDLGYDAGEIEFLVGSSDIVADVQATYHREFDQVVEDYNKGKRADRQIKDYFEKVSADSKTDLATEIILQIGDKDYWESRKVEGRFTYEDTERMKVVFGMQLKALQEKCPDFKVASAVIHYDESSPHMHIVGVPIAKGYKRGMTHQTAKTKVFTQESLRELQDYMRQTMLIQMRNLGYEVELQLKQQGRNKDYEKGALQGLNKAIKEKQAIKSKADYEAVQAQIRVSELHQQKDSLKSDIVKGYAELEDIANKSLEASRTLSEAQEGLKQAQESQIALKRQIEALTVHRDAVMDEAGKAQEILSDYNKQIYEKQGTVKKLNQEVLSLQAEKQGALAIIQEAEDTKAMFEDLLDVYNEREVTAAKEECDEVYNEIRPQMLPDEQRAYQQEDIATLQGLYKERSEGVVKRYQGGVVLKAKQGVLDEPPKDRRSEYFFGRFFELLERFKEYIRAKKKPTLEQLREAYLESKEDRSIDIPYRNNDGWSI